MAQVKCKYCGQSFDRTHEPYHKIGNRYAHLICHEKYLAEEEKQKKDRQAILDFIQQHYKNPNYPMIQQQLNNFTSKLGYTYSGILRTLQYYYDVLNNSTEKGNDGIGIVPYVYDQAKQYWYNMWLINKKNANVVVEKTEQIVHITEPKRKPMRKQIFTFLDEEEKTNE